MRQFNNNMFKVRIRIIKKLNYSGFLNGLIKLIKLQNKGLMLKCKHRRTFLKIPKKINVYILIIIIIIIIP